MEEQEDLVKLWEALLEAAMDPTKARAVRRGFVETLKLFDPADALVFQFVSALRMQSLKDLVGCTPEPANSVYISIENLVKLRVVRGDTSDFILSPYGAELKRALGLPSL
ncbi:hypothetical protein ABAC460_02140 [Asticcacaulis sp. AC460]|nr:hypothetical protein ABAC460_02140 [Asticcacaulis sp. AC460]